MLFSFVAMGSASSAGPLESAPSASTTAAECAIYYSTLHNKNTAFKYAIGASVGLHVGALTLSQTNPELFSSKKSASTEQNNNDAKKEEKKLILKSEEELIAEAQANLATWKTEKKLKTSLTDFLIYAEIERDPEELQATRLNSLLEFKKNVDEDLRKLKDSNKLFQDIREKILAKYIKTYCRDNALYTDYTESNCGNCEAQSKFVIAHLLEAKISPPSGYEFGIQVFSDHIQPVLFNKKNKKVLEFVSGKEHNEIIAPIHSPALFHCAYLKGKNISPENFRCPEDTLLAEGPKLAENGKDSGAKSNTKMRYDSKDKLPSYGGGAALRTELNFDKILNVFPTPRAPLKIDCKPEGSPASKYKYKNRIEISDFDFLYAGNIHSNYSNEVEEIGMGTSRRRSKEPTITLRDPEDCKRIKAASSEAEMIRLAQQISIEEMNRLLRSKEYDSLISIFKKFQQNKKETMAELRKLYQTKTLAKDQKTNSSDPAIQDLEKQLDTKLGKIWAEMSGNLNNEGFIKALNHYRYLTETFKLGENSHSKPPVPAKLKYLIELRNESVEQMRVEGLDWMRIFSETTLDNINDFISSLDIISHDPFDYLFPSPVAKPVFFIKDSKSAIHSLAPYFSNPAIVQIRETTNTKEGKKDGKESGKEQENNIGNKAGILSLTEAKSENNSERSDNRQGSTEGESFSFQPQGKKPLIIHMQIASTRERVAKKGEEIPAAIQVPERPILMDYKTLVELLDSEKTNCCKIQQNGFLAEKYLEQKLQRLDRNTVAYDNQLFAKLKSTSSNPYAHISSEGSIRILFAAYARQFFDKDFVTFFNNESNRKRLGYGAESVRVRYKPENKYEYINGQTVAKEQPEEIHGPYPKEIGQFIINILGEQKASIVE